MRHRATKQTRATVRKQARAARRRQRQQAERHAMFVRMHKKFERPQTTRPAGQRKRSAGPTLRPGNGVSVLHNLLFVNDWLAGARGQLRRTGTEG